MSELAERAAAIEAELGQLRDTRVAAIEELEAAAAFDRDTASLRKRIAAIESQIELAEAAKRGVGRRLLLEQRETLTASIDDGEAAYAEGIAAFEVLVVQRAALAAELEAMGAEIDRARVVRDNAGIALSRRREKLQLFLEDNETALHSAERMVA